MSKTMDLMARRADMMSPEWNYEWDASNGVLNSSGFVRTDVGTLATQPSINGDALAIRGNSTNYVNYGYPRHFASGVMEAEIRTANNAQFILSFGNGNYGIGIRLQTSTNYKGIYLGGGLSIKLADAVAATTYKVRIVLKGAIADVYINDVLIVSDLNATEHSECADVLVSGRGTGGTHVWSYLYSLKMKFGRTQ